MCAACQSCHNSWKLFHDCVCCTTLTFMELLQSTCLVVHWDSGSFNLFLKLLTCLFKHQTSMESRQTTPNSSETTGLIFWCVVFSPQGRVWWDFYPFLGQRSPTLISLCSPTRTLWCQCKFPGSQHPVSFFGWKQYHKK